MDLYRFRLFPESPWRTPWQSDTLAGMLCWMCARTEGEEVLSRRIIEPASSGRPPFVLSDAFPGDQLPLPAAVRLLEAPVEDRKTVKRAKWLSTAAFKRFQLGQVPSISDLVSNSGILEYTQLRNTIGRSTNTTADGGSLFPTQEAVLEGHIAGLTVYVRVEPDFVEFFWQLMRELAQWGFGSDRSIGKGHFRLDSALEPAGELDAPGGADGCVVLSTFQPAARDPTDGAWEAFTKYGKLGPDFGLENVFKRPIIVLRPGACFQSSPARGWMGQAIPMHELLAKDIVDQLSLRGAPVVHWAFGLSVPMSWPTGELSGSAPAADAAESDVSPQAAPQGVEAGARPTTDQDTATVKVLERREIAGKVQFFVQEEGKPRGVLAYGVPPSPNELPQVGQKITVYRNNRDPRNPQYRWDKPAARQGKPKSRPGGRQRG